MTSFFFDFLLRYINRSSAGPTPNFLISSPLCRNIWKTSKNRVGNRPERFSHRQPGTFSYNTEQRCTNLSSLLSVAWNHIIPTPLSHEGTTYFDLKSENKDSDGRRFKSFTPGPIPPPPSGVCKNPREDLLCKLQHDPPRLNMLYRKSRARISERTTLEHAISHWAPA